MKGDEFSNEPGDSDDRNSDERAIEPHLARNSTPAFESQRSQGAGTGVDSPGGESQSASEPREERRFDRRPAELDSAGPDSNQAAGEAGEGAEPGTAEGEGAGPAGEGQGRRLRDRRDRGGRRRDDRPRPPQLQPQPQPQQRREAASDDDEDAEETDGEEESFGPDDPLGAAFDLHHGAPIETQPAHAHKHHVATKVTSAKEFFNAELLYRYDILEDTQRDEVSGTYRMELRGYSGGVWTLFVDPLKVEVVNRREDADIVFIMQQRDFLQLVNGQLNPQLAILSQKMRVTGDIRKAVAVQRILCPPQD